MKKHSIKHLLFAAATMIFQLAAVCGTIERDELFFSALEENGLKRTLLLIKAAEAEPETASSPLAMLHKTLLRRQEMAECIKQYDLLWKKFPDHPEIVWNGIMLYEKHSRLSKNILENLKKSSSLYSASGPHHPLIREIIRQRLILHTLLGDSRDGVKFAEKLTGFHGELATLYNTAAYRAEVSGDTKAAAELHKKYLDAVKNNVENSPEPLHTSSLAMLMMRLFERSEYEHAEAVFELIRKKTSNQEILDQVRTLYCMKSRDFDKVKREADAIKGRSVRKDVLLFNAALNARKWDTAKKLFKSLPAENRAREELLLAVSINDAEILLRAAKNPAYSKNEQMLLKFHAASLKKDKNLYYEAKKMVGNKPLSIDTLNTIGYTAAEIGIELKEAEAMLRRVVQAAPFNAAYLDSLAFICCQQRRYAEAEKLISRALECITLDIPASVLLEHAGDIAAAQGNFHRAKELYQRAVNMGNNDTSFNIQAVKNKIDRLK